MVTPILAHGADLLVLPFLVGGIVTIMIALKDGQQKRSSVSRLPATGMGRQIRAAMRMTPPVRRDAPGPYRPPRSQPPAVRLLTAETGDTRRPVPARWNG